jgi:hypothetical protein
MRTITVREAITIARPREEVWEFTQDWTRRSSWDPAIAEAAIETEEPRTIRARSPDGTRFVVRYKQYERPHKTSLAMTDVASAWMQSGGGSWLYEDDGAGTRWTQTNSLVLRPWAGLLTPLVRWQLRRSTRQAMLAAKRKLEAP